MSSITKLNTFSISNNSLKNEINNKLPLELEEKKNEYEEKKNQMKLQLQSYNEKVNEYDYIVKMVQENEKNLEDKKSEIDKLNRKQKQNFVKINSNYFNSFLEIYNEKNKEIYKIFLIFINIKEENIIQFEYLFNNKEALITLLSNSFENFKLIYEINIDDYKNKKKNIFTLIDNLKKSVKYPYNILLNFIRNTFQIIDLMNENKINETKLFKLFNKKNKIFLEKINLEGEIQKNKNNLNILEKYINNVDAILKKYKSIFSPKIENRNEIMENVLKSYKNLKKNDYFKKNSFNKSSQNSMIENLSKQIPKTKQISILTIKDFNKKSQKPINLNKKVLNYLNQNIKGIHYNNTIQINAIISTDISESGEKIKKEKINIAKLKSKNIVENSKSKTIKSSSANNSYKKNKFVKKNKINFPHNKFIMKFQKVNKAESDNDDSGLNAIYDNDNILNEKYDISSESHIQNLKNEEIEINDDNNLKQYKSKNQKFQKYNYQNSERINFSNTEKINNNDNCWASCT